MADRVPSVEDDIALLTRWLDDPAALRSLMSDHDFLRSESEARRYVEGLLVGLEDVRNGRTFSHEQVLRESEARRRRYRSTAAE